MPADSILYKKLAEELDRELRGGRIDKIIMPDKSMIMLHIRAQGANKNLLITAAAQPRCFLTKEKLTAAAVPPSFCLHLRKHVGGGIIKSVNTAPFERIIIIELTSFGDLGEPRDKKLYIEMMGKYSNVVVADDSGRISDALKHISADEGRPILPGFTFKPPVPRGLAPDDTDAVRQAISQVSDEEPEKALMSTVCGLAPVTAKEAVSRGGDIADNLMSIINAELRPTVYFNGGEAKDFSFCEYTVIPGDKKHYDSISAAMDEYYSSRGGSKSGSDTKSMLIRILNGATEKYKKRLGSLVQDAQNAAGFDDERIIGELITANLYKIQKGDLSVTVDDWYSGEQRTIMLDGGTPSKCAEKHFARYQKKKRTVEIVGKQILELEAQIDYFESIFQSLEIVEGEEELEEIASELESAGLIKTQKKGRKSETSQPRRFDVSGYTLTVGKSNMQNDQITKAAKGDDIWLHTQGVHGSHAVLSIKGKQSDNEVIRKAAGIAAFFSKARQSENVAVDYTKVKNVRKPKGSPPGKVEYVNQKTIYVNPTPPENK